MSVGTTIEWTDASWTPVKARRKDTGKVGWHCERVSDGCKNCYAATFNGRMLPNGGTGLDFTRQARDQVEIFIDEKTLAEPLRWKKPRKVFVCSMTDLFAEFVPFEFIDKVFAVMALCPQHQFQILTKRPERMAEYLETRTAMDDSHRVHTLPQWYQVYTHWFDEGYGGGRFFDTERAWDSAHSAAETINPTQPLRNVWLGTSVEDQAQADKRIPHLLKCPAAIRFLSVEPMLGAVDLEPFLWGVVGSTAGYFDRNGVRRSGGIGGQMMCSRPQNAIHWIIVGGESGHGARPCDMAWVRSIVNQCKAAGVPAFVKQLGACVVQRCSNCGKMTGNCRGGMVDACGPGHAQLAAEAFNVRNSKGGDISEFPADLRIREFPNLKGGVQ